MKTNHGYKPNHFRPREFRNWWPHMSKLQLQLLDAFRANWGNPVVISMAAGALGRRLGPDANSQHNFDKWKEVRATDIFPLIRMPSGPCRGCDEQELKQAYEIAKAVGFTGVGVYPHWIPHPGLHVDCREDREVGDPAKWGGIKTGKDKQIYVSVEEAFKKFDKK